MAHTHEHDCIACGAHFDSSEELARHNEKAHLRTATGMERPRADRTGAPPQDLRDRNPRQGFVDPRSDRSDAT